MLPSRDSAEIERRIGYTFKDKKLLEVCFTHSSYAHQHGTESNERLEFLGDAVLGFLVSEKLYREGVKNEGSMTDLRKNLVSAPPLKEAVERMGLTRFLLAASPSGVGEKAVSSLFEALVAGIYLDGGMKAAERFVREKLLSVPHSGRNYKGELQEFLQGRGLARAEYRIVNCSGEPHAPLFEAEVSAEGESARAVGTGKAAAEKAAAAKLLAKLQKISGEYRH